MAKPLNSRFLSAFREVEASIADRSSPSRSFRDAIYQAGRAGRLTPAESRDLEELYAMRNILSHYGIDGQDAFEVSSAAVRRMEQLRNKLTGKAPTIQGMLGRVETVEPSTTMGAAASIMASQDYSCLPVYEGSVFCGALDADIVMHWAGEGLAADELLIDSAVSEIRGRYPDPQLEFCREDALQRDVAWAFEAAMRERVPLAAILATSDGTPQGKLRGIITPWDVPSLSR